MPNVFLLRTSLLVFAPLFAADQLLLNRVGYELTGPKTAVVRGEKGMVATTGFDVLDASGQVVLTGVAGPVQTVPGWGGTGWKVLDFSTLGDSGTFRLVAKPSGDTASFTVRKCNLLRTAGPAVVDFFKSMRNTDAGDRAMGYFGQDDRGKHDVFGGWKDATGDAGKYLSHLSYANFMNPQQIPMVVWSLLRTRLLAPATTEPFKSKLLSEAAWGADYLLRVQDPQGYFYINIFDHWGSEPRKISAWTGTAEAQGTMTSDYQAAWREGGGMSIAALALAARMGISGDSGSAQYLAGARRGFAHLSSKTARWADDGRENLIDHYCALLAATELYLATQEIQYLDSAAARADSIVNRQTADKFFVSDAGGRPFFHGVDEGLPMVAMWAYLEVDGASERAARVRLALQKSVEFYSTLTRQVANPFVYPRMYTPIASATEPSGNGNVALGKKAWATEVESGNPASAAFDGIDDKGHRWSAYKSGLTSDLSGYHATLEVDLAGNFNLTQIVLSWEGAYATKYKLWVAGADTSNWTLLKAVDEGKGGRETHSLPEGVWARYVKIECLSRALEYGGFSIQEMTVVGQKEISNVPVKVPGKTSFFMPHKNETNYWWQGENARLGSMAAGLLLAGRGTNSGWNFSNDTLSEEVIGPLDWVSGKNTENVNFVYGLGGGTYAAYIGGTNHVGGICNGITATSDSDATPVFNNDGGVANWRWVEQWLPHDSWYLLGIASVAHSVEFPNSVGVKPLVRKPEGFRMSRGPGGVDLESSADASWSLLSVTGQVFDRGHGAKVHFAPGRGAWIVQCQASDGRVSSKALVIP